LRIAVLSPFVDRSHGTERALAELLQRLIRNHACEVHLYAQSVKELEVIPFQRSSAEFSARVVWHRVPKIPGPHLLQFSFWLVANRFSRWRDTRFHGVRYDAVFSPGINALDADTILVHAIFHRLRELQDASVQSGLRRLHRTLYYRLLCFLESRVYQKDHLRLAAVSRHTASQLNDYFGRMDVQIIPNGVDTSHFSPENCSTMRAAARRKLGYAREEVVLLLVGNDLRNKGLPVLLESLCLCRNLPLRLCVVGNDAASVGSAAVGSLQLQDRVTFAGETSDILAYYAAADIYVAPSREDSFNLPALEAMACGLPVIVSTNAGVSEMISDSKNGLLLRNAESAGELAGLIQRLAGDRKLRVELGEAAARSATTCTWEENASKFYEFLLAKRFAHR